MEPAPNTIVAFGFDRLFLEVVAKALADRGWRVIDSTQVLANPAEVIDLALVFSNWNSDSVIACLRSARAQFPGARIVLFGVQDGDAEFLRFVEEGMKAWVTPRHSLADLHDTLLQVRLNRTSTSGRITQLVLNSIGTLSGQQPESYRNRLTSRESEILRLICDGLANKEIAHRLCIAPNTVKNHVHHLLEKLQVRSRHEAAWIRTRAQPAGTLPNSMTGRRSA
jgi:DNA-binding NarL/FixJ family response regulator